MIQTFMDKLKYDDNGLIPAVVQDYATGEVLMLAYMNREALNKTIETGNSWFFSRSRNRLWQKGETSGNVQKVISISIDCDMDTLLLLVNQRGVACHTGNMSCFYRDIRGKKDDAPFKADNILRRLYSLIGERARTPKEGSYTNYLLQEGIDKTLKKVGEEASEVIIGAKNPGKRETIYEIADLLYHVTVLMYQKDIGYDEVFRELTSRYK